MRRVVVYPGTARRIMQTDKVRAALKAKAEKVAARADVIAADEAYEVHAHVVEGTRPKGRPYARVQSDDADQEFGTWGKKRRRILGRAAQEG